MLLPRMWTWHDAEYLFRGYKVALCTCFALECLITNSKDSRFYSNPKYRFSKWIILRIHESLAFCLFTTDNNISLQIQFYYRKTNNTPNGTFVIIIIIIITIIIIIAMFLRIRFSVLLQFIIKSHSHKLLFLYLFIYISAIKDLKPRLLGTQIMCWLSKDEHLLRKCIKTSLRQVLIVGHAEKMRIKIRKSYKLSADFPMPNIFKFYWIFLEIKHVFGKEYLNILCTFFKFF